MKFKLEFDCNNSMFDESKEKAISEVVVVTGMRISEVYKINGLLEPGTSYSIRDENGNSIGFFMVEDE